jgi:hypothetical protein
LKRYKKIQTQVTLLPFEWLVEHEEVDPVYLEVLITEIASDGILKLPITVDKATNVIIDGHHRFHALRQLSCKNIPVALINYDSDDIRVLAWNEEEQITKKTVLNAAFSGKKLPPKTSKHLVLVNGSFQHISALEEEVNIPLSTLR